MATQKRRSSTSKASSAGAPGWVWMLFGLSLGLVVAAAVYVSDRRGQVAAFPTPPVQASPPQSRIEPAPEAAQTPPHPATRFDFYDVLPKFEVVIPEVEFEARPDRVATSVGEPGSYVLQAGSFGEYSDAERMKANLALLGIESRIQKVTIETDDFHRVRVGPMSDLDELNGVRRRLWDAEIEVLLIKVPN